MACSPHKPQTRNDGAEVCAVCSACVRAAYPHCDSLVLHAPSTCVFCDLYPDRQQARIENGVAFTGQDCPALRPCPATVERSLDTIERWHGNVPVTQEMQEERDKEMEALHKQLMSEGF